MIKSITILRRTPSSSSLRSIEKFFDGLGFEPGLNWKDTRSQGSGFIAPVGQVEFVSGEAPALAGIMIQVTGLDTLHGIIHRRGGAARSRRPSPIAQTAWGARLFYAEPAPGARIAFWEWASPEKQPAKPGSVARQIEGSLNANGRKFGIVVSRWNSFITERLLQGAIDALRRSGAPPAALTVVRVPGAFEIPSAARALAQTGKVHAIVCLGCLIKGETPHYQHISAEVTRGIGQSAQETGVPHAFGVLTCENLDQAIDRAGLKSGNKGFEAAMAAVEMANLGKQLRPAPGFKAKTRSQSKSAMLRPAAAMKTAPARRGPQPRARKVAR